MERYDALINAVCSIPKNVEDLTKEEIISTVKSIQNIAEKLPICQDKVKAQRQISEKPFHFTWYKKRHVALKFLYLGWDYDGLAVQNNTEGTIEAHIFKALMKTKLVESRETSNFHRCGRTDKGVSAFSQVISLDLRSNLLEGLGVIVPEQYDPCHQKSNKEEINYCLILNRVLPKEIRMVAWAPVEPNFSARFDCIQRTYKYWFPKADLDIEAMNLAAQSLIGDHDFRNFCKLDGKKQAPTFRRTISKVEISPVLSCGDGPYGMMEFTIVGSSYLWHQIRCIMAVLILIGQGKEDIKIISQLLDVERKPQKPQYSMASEIPLVLYKCDYENIKWLYCETSLKLVTRQLQTMWTSQAIKAVILRRMLSELDNISTPAQSIASIADSLIMGLKSKQHKKLLDRPVCACYEQKITHQNKKRKLNEKLE